MRRVTPVLAFAMSAVAAPAAATFVFAPGETETIAFDGRSDDHAGGTAAIPGLGARLTLAFQGFDGNLARFDWTLENLAGAPMTSARVSGFGFDVEGPFNLSASKASGDLNRIGSGTMPMGFGSVGFCLRQGGGGGGCSGGGGGGVAIGGTLSGSFGLAFTTPQPLVTLDRMVVRYQSLSSPGLGLKDASGIGTPTPVMTGLVPEPRTWAMLIVGFGLVGLAMRRRRDNLGAEA